MKRFLIVVLCCLATLTSWGKLITPNDFKGSDTERIQKAVNAAAKSSQIVTIPRSNSNGTNIWMIDKAILLPSNITVILDNATMQLSDKCRDNMFRSNNVGAGIENPKWNHNINILGYGKSVMRGAVNPRASGDGLRHLNLNAAPNYNKDRSSYGSDAGKAGERQMSDWRNFMIEIAYVDSFQLKNVRIEYAHCWAVNFEHTHHAIIKDIEFFCPQYRYLADGKIVYTFNNDGIDLREGCKYFRIDNINAVTGDDVIALSCLDMGEKYHKNGDINSFQVTSCAHNGPQDDIEYVYISNVVTAYNGVALRASDSATIHHVYINGITVCKDPLITTPYIGCPYTLLVGNNGYGKMPKKPQIHDVYAQNLVGDGKKLINVASPISDCVFMNGVYTGKIATSGISWNDGTQQTSTNVQVINVIKNTSAYDNSTPPKK